MARSNGEAIKADDGFSDSDFLALAEWRYRIRLFLRFSEGAAREAGLEPQHYLFMLALKGLPEGVRARIGELAERLQLQHHSTVELVDRLERNGLVQRKRSPQDRREVLLTLTPRGEKLVRKLARTHKEHLQTEGPALLKALSRIVGSTGKKRQATG